jgi:hypothetical protein
MWTIGWDAGHVIRPRIGVRIAVGTDLVVDDCFVVCAYTIDTKVLSDPHVLHPTDQTFSFLVLHLSPMYDIPVILPTLQASVA